MSDAESGDATARDTTGRVDVCPGCHFPYDCQRSWARIIDPSRVEETA